MIRMEPEAKINGSMIRDPPFMSSRLTESLITSSMMPHNSFASNQLSQMCNPIQMNKPVVTPIQKMNDDLKL